MKKIPYCSKYNTDLGVGGVSRFYLSQLSLSKPQFIHL